MIVAAGKRRVASERACSRSRPPRSPPRPPRLMPRPWLSGNPGNVVACAALGATINGLEGYAATNPKAASGLQQAADALKGAALAQGCFVSPCLAGCSY